MISFKQLRCRCLTSLWDSSPIALPWVCLGVSTLSTFGLVRKALTLHWVRWPYLPQCLDLGLESAKLSISITPNNFPPHGWTLSLKGQGLPVATGPALWLTKQAFGTEEKEKEV